MDVKAKYHSWMQLAFGAVYRLLSLEYVIFEDIRRSEGPRQYRKFAIPDLMPWWTALACGA